MGRVTLFSVLALLVLQCTADFTPYQRTWKYKGDVRVSNVAGAHTKNGLASVWGMTARVVAQHYGDHVVAKIKDVQTSIVNGYEDDLEKLAIELKDIPLDSAAILKPVIIYVRDISNISIVHEADDPVWSVNMKRGIISAFMFHNSESEEHTVPEHTHYGTCKVSYNVYETGDYHILEKTIDHTSCEDNPVYGVSIKTWDPTNNEHNPFIVDSTYTYTFNGKTEIKNLKRVHTKSVLQYQSMPAVKSIQRVEQSKELGVLSVTETFEKFDTSSITVHGNLTFDYSKGLSGGRDEGNPKTSPKELIKEFNENYDEFKEYFNTVPLRNINSDDNDTITPMFDALQEMDQATLKELSTDIFTKGDNLYQHMFLSYLPYLGTEESIKFIKALIETEDEHLNDLLAIKILSTFPVYVDDHSEELLKEMEPLMNLKVSNNQVKYAGILSFASLVADVYENDKVDKKIYNKYVSQYYKNFKDAEQHETKMTYLLGLMNMDGPSIADMIEICADATLSHHLRTLAIFGFKRTLKTEGDDVYKHFWPIVKNHEEHYEIRVAALDLLLYTDLSYEHFQNIIHWYHDEFENPEEYHLAHYLYTTVKSLENSTGYYEPLGAYATEAMETMKPVKSHRVWSTGNYRMAFTDAGANIGGSLQARLIADPSTNIINVGIFSVDTFAISLNLGTYTAYIKTEGLPDLGFLFAIFSGRESDSPVQSLVDLIKKHAYKLKEFEGAHVEVVIFCDDNVVFGMHIDESNIKHYSENPLFLDLLKLLVDYNTLNFPLQDYTYMVSDLGTGIQISNDIYDMASYEMDSIDKFFAAISDSSEEVDAIEYNLKYRSLWIYSSYVESYNPLIDGSAETYKLVKEEAHLNIPYSFNLTDFVFKWKHTKDSFNYIEDHVLGTYVESSVLHSYCSGCEEVIQLPVGATTHQDYRSSKFESISGIHFNITESEDTEEQERLDAIEPAKTSGIQDIINNHQTNSFSVPFIKPILYVWHATLYTIFLDDDISSLSIRTEPYYNEPTETVFDFDFDVNDIKNDRDPISGEEFDFTVAFTNRKSHNAEVLNYVNVTFVYTTKSESPDTETQPHIEHNYDVKIYLEDKHHGNNKICIDREVLYPSRRVDKFSLETIEPTKATTKIQFGEVQKLDDACPSVYIAFTEIYTSTEKQKQHMEALEEHEKCKKESKGFKYVPPTDDCFASHKVISKYDACTLYADFSQIQGAPAEVVEASKTEFGMKLFEYRRLNHTHISLAFSEDFSKHILEKASPNIEKYMKVSTRDPSELMSLSPSVVAYDDHDLRIGVSSACYITPSQIRDFHGKVINDYNTKHGPDAVAFVECINNTQSGLTIQRLGDHTVGFHFWSENNTLVASAHDGKVKIVYNGKEHSETDVKDDDFKIYFLDHDVVYVTNDLVDIHYTTEYISVKTPSIYNNYICGLCTGEKH